MLHQIGPWSFDDESGTLAQGAELRHLEYRAAHTLALLCRRRGDVVTRDDLLREVWSGRSVSANSVAIVIGDLRRALADDPQAARHIVTIAKRGYRLTLETATMPPANPLRRHLLMAGAAGLVLAGAGIFVGVHRAGHSVRIVVEPTSNGTEQSDYDGLASALSEVIADHAATFKGVDIVRGRAGDLRLTSRLILWDGLPTVYLNLQDEASGIVRWSARAKGEAGILAALTAAKLDELGRRIHEF